MEREQILQLLARHKRKLAQRYGVLRLALFGSAARGSADADSDIDIKRQNAGSESNVS